MKSPRPVTTAVAAAGQPARTRRMPSATSSTWASASARAMASMAASSSISRSPQTTRASRSPANSRVAGPAVGSRGTCSPTGASRPSHTMRVADGGEAFGRYRRRGRPRAGPRGAAPPPASAPRRCRPARRLRQPRGIGAAPGGDPAAFEMGMMSVEVVPMSTRMPSGTNRATSVAVAAQFDAADGQRIGRGRGRRHEPCRPPCTRAADRPGRRGPARRARTPRPRAWCGTPARARPSW